MLKQCLIPFQNTFLTRKGINTNTFYLFPMVHIRGIPSVKCLPFIDQMFMFQGVNVCCIRQHTARSTAPSVVQTTPRTIPPHSTACSTHLWRAKTRSLKSSSRTLTSRKHIQSEQPELLQTQFKCNQRKQHKVLMSIVPHRQSIVKSYCSADTKTDYNDDNNCYSRYNKYFKQ